ncbi:MAG: phage holin family protein [Candidatus Accumulibacter sp.]|nr:phage holin family protein [Accumulibacter sp.]
MRLILHWLLNTLALLGVAYLLPSVQVTSFSAAMIAALVLGLVNALLRPVLILLTLPVTVLTLGLFLFVINGLTFWLAGAMLAGFDVGGFWPAVFGALLYSIFSSILSWLLPLGKKD